MPDERTDGQATCNRLNKRTRREPASRPEFVQVFRAFRSSFVAEADVWIDSGGAVGGDVAGSERHGGEDGGDR